MTTKQAPAPSAKVLECQTLFSEYMTIVLDLLDGAVRAQGSKAAITAGQVGALRLGLGLLPIREQMLSFNAAAKGRWANIQAKQITVVEQIVADIFAKNPLVESKAMVAVLKGGDKDMHDGLLECLVGMAEQTIKYAHLAGALPDLDAGAEAKRFGLTI